MLNPQNKTKKKKTRKMTPTPKFGKTPLELLEPNTEYDPTFFEKYGHSVLGPIMGFGMSLSANLGTKRPLVRASKSNAINFVIVWRLIDYTKFKFFQFAHRCTTAYSIRHWWLFCIQLVQKLQGKCECRTWCSLSSLHSIASGRFSTAR